jgi:cysteine dioxygenase
MSDPLHAPPRRDSFAGLVLEPATSGPIAALCSALDLEFARDARGRGAAGLLAAYSATHGDWRHYAHPRKDCYTRNLVRRSAAYELLVLCWGAGQESPIHNHMDQCCWMAVLEGPIEEVLFDLPSTAPAPLIERSARRFERGQAAYIDDGMGVHLVRGVAGASGVSLHLYARPYGTCLVYDRASGAAAERVLSYDSIGGVPTADGQC